MRNPVPHVYYDANGKVVRDDGPGKCGAHGPQNEFVVTMRDKTHPITKDLPDFWMYSKDECYSLLRGPAENMTILATAADTPELKAKGRNEPMLMVLSYGRAACSTPRRPRQRGLGKSRRHHHVPAWARVRCDRKNH